MQQVTSTTDATSLQGRLDEIDRQLLTRSPTALDEAVLLVDRKNVYDALHPEAGQGGDRRSSAYRDGIKTKSLSFCSDVALRLGCSERLVQLKVSMGEALYGLADTLRASPISDNGAALRTFADLDAGARLVVLGVWTERPKLSFRGALVEARLRQEEDSEAKAFSRLLDAWTRSGSKARRRFLEEIGCDAQAAAKLIAAWRKRGGR